jgi:hypothetical protein
MRLSAMRVVRKSRSCRGGVGPLIRTSDDIYFNTTWQIVTQVEVTVTRLHP